MENGKLKESLDEIFDKASAMVLSTDCGVMTIGDGEEIAKILGLTVAYVLFNNICDEITLKRAIVAGYKTARKVKSIKANLEEAKAPNIFENILKDLFEI